VPVNACLNNALPEVRQGCLPSETSAQEDDAFHHDLAGSIPDGNRNTFLVYMQTNLFNVASHKRAFRIGLASQSGFGGRFAAMTYGVIPQVQHFA